jgi:hypothetical protein
VPADGGKEALERALGERVEFFRLGPAPSSEDRGDLMLTDGAWLQHGGDASRVHGEIFGADNAARMQWAPSAWLDKAVSAWMGVRFESDDSFPLRTWVEVTYRPQGKGQQPRSAWLCSTDLPTFRARLEAALGPLAVYAQNQQKGEAAPTNSTPADVGLDEPDAPDASDPLGVMLQAGIVFHSAAHAAAAFPGIGSARSLKDVWQRQNLAAPCIASLTSAAFARGIDLPSGTWATIKYTAAGKQHTATAWSGMAAPAAILFAQGHDVVSLALH